MSHSEQSAMHETVLPRGFPPNSPFTTALLINRITTHVHATHMNTTTLKPSDPAGT